MYGRARLGSTELAEVLPSRLSERRVLCGSVRASPSLESSTPSARVAAIDDEATVALMRLFYHKLSDEKKPPAVALRHAQLFLLHHPEQIKSLATRGSNFSKLVDRPEGGTVSPARLTASPRVWAAFVIAGPGSLGETK
jgi:hypothetical protein